MTQKKITRKLLKEAISTLTALKSTNTKLNESMPLKEMEIYLLDEEGEGVVLCRTRPPLTRDIWMFHGSTPSPAAQAFIETTSRLRDEGGMGNAG